MSTFVISGNASLILRGELRNKIGFKDMVSCLKFAYSYALIHNLPPITENPTSGNPITWSTDTIDIDTLVNIVKILSSDKVVNLSDSDLIEYVRGLMHAGIYELEKKWNENPKITISDII